MPFVAGRLWLITFVDLLSLLLCFFVLMVSMTAPRGEAWEALIGSLRAELNPGRSRGHDAAAGERWRGLPAPAGNDLRYLQAVIEAKLAQQPALAQARLRRHDDRLVLSLPADLLFGSDSVLLRAEAGAATVALAQALTAVANRIELQGHASDWELSLARAAALADALVAQGYGGRMTVYGLGNGRHVDLVIREEGRRG